MRNLILDVFASSGQQFANTTRHDPYRNFNFSVEFVGSTGIIKTGWQQVTGLKLRHDFTEYREGGNNGVPEQIHNESRYEPITMRRGMSEDSTILKFLSKSYGTDGVGIKNNTKTSVVIKVRERDRTTFVKKFTLRDVWITAFETSDLDAMGSEVLMDIVTLSFTGVDF